MKILYLMHVDWNWIKQRPQFIAETIAKMTPHKVIVLYIKNFNYKALVNNIKTPRIKPIPIPRLPFNRVNIVSKINDYLEYIFISIKVLNCDLIYVTHPIFFPSIKNIKNIKIIYDCMDDILQLQYPEEKKNIFSKFEKNLIQNGFLTIFSAKYLYEVVKKRIGITFDYIILNNALNIPSQVISNSNKLKELFKSREKRIVTYIGTISEWLDYNLLIELVRMNKSLCIYLFGPMIYQFPHEDGIFWWGPQNYEDIFFIMNNSDALIMPFKVNELILSVNPVKLYEYIFSGKPAIAVKYDETICFEDFVYLYENGNINSLISIFNILDNTNYSPKKPINEMKQFALSNTWERRVEQLIKMSII